MAAAPAIQRDRLPPARTCAAFQRRGDLQPHVILIEIQPPSSRGVARVEPLLTDEHQKNAALVHSLGDGTDEVLARAQGIDIAKDAVRTEPPLERLVQPARVSRGIVAPVTDEGRGHAECRSRWRLYRRGRGKFTTPWAGPQIE